jgi:cyclophilin family peptidyl-prolyl cis-trans isomerase
MKHALLALTLLLIAPLGNAQDAADPRVSVETSVGSFVLELSPEKAPTTVEHFIELVEQGFYDGLIFHRVIPEFMIQGGGYTTEFKEREDEVRLQNESMGGLSNLRGTIAMARMRNPHSANSQFFVNVKDNTRLDAQPEYERWGYTVFGRVIDGMDVVDEISLVETARRGTFGDVPVETVVIEKMTLVDAD